MTGEVKSLLALVSEENAVCSRREKEHANRKALSRHRSTQGLFNQAARKKVGSHQSLHGRRWPEVVRQPLSRPVSLRVSVLGLIVVTKPPQGLVNFPSLQRFILKNLRLT